jgi:hypothetical protein
MLNNEDVQCRELDKQKRSLKERAHLRDHGICVRTISNWNLERYDMGWIQLAPDTVQ